MAEQQSGAMANSSSTSSDQAKTWIGVGGVALLMLGILGAVVMWSEMDDDYYTTVDRWSVVLAGMLVAGVGLLALGLAAVLGRMGR